jgi:hypothetical protein
MKVGYLHIMKAMQGNSKGYVVLAWQGKSWWSWAVWWFPNKDGKWGTYGWHRTRHFLVGKLGELHLQHQM